MKLVIGFVLGLVAFGVVILGIRMATVAVAETDDDTLSADNATQSILDILPDFEKIYRVALTLPFEKAESKIYDEDIAEFYHELMDKTGLSETVEETP